MKKLVALFLCIIMCLGFCLPANAVHFEKGTKLEPECIEYNFGDESAKLIDAGTHIVVITDKPSKRNTPAALSDSSAEHRESNAIIYVPYNVNSHNKIYDDLSDLLKVSPNSIEIGESEVNGPDKNACATFFMTVHYTRETAPDRYVYYAITSVTGGFTDSGTTGSYVGENVYVTDLALDVSQTGSDLDNGHFTNTQYKMDIPLSNSKRNWSYTTPSSWTAVSDAGFGSLVGARYKFTLARGSSSWTSSLELTLSSTLNWQY